MHSFIDKTKSVGRALLMMLIIPGFLLATVPEPAAGENYIEVLDRGKIDWTNGFIEAFGVGRPPANPLNAAHARAVAQRNADVAARNNLIELVGDIRVDSEALVADHLAEGKIPLQELETVLRDARAVDLSYGRDEEVQVKVSIRLQGSLAELLLPEDIRIITTVKQPQEANQKEEPFSGLLVDCRGITFQPGMVPLIVDEDGAVLYGPAFASRDHAVERGMVSYMRNIDSATKDPRVGPKPLSVKAIRTVEGKPCDIMISHADAAQIRGLASNLNFLHQCRVLLVVD
jgi:hypothetical protein